MAVDSYRINQDPDLAFQRWVNLGPTAPSLLDTILKDPATQKPALILDYQSVIEKSHWPHRVSLFFVASSIPNRTHQQHLPQLLLQL